jgi:hypothetical protein
LTEGLIKIENSNYDFSGNKLLLFAGDNFIGKKIIEFAEEKEMDIYIIDLKEHKNSELEEDYGDHYFVLESLKSEDLERIMFRFSKEKIKFDYLIFNYYFDKLRAKKNAFSSEKWDQLLEDWTLNCYLIFKNIYPFLNKDQKNRIVYFNSARGYTGDDCTAPGGDIIEAGLAGALTGVMTSIAREIIPEGVSVNSIALSDNYQDKWLKIKWVLTLWLSGIAEYSCAETITIS